jgi:hypothetical protein
MRVAAVVRLTLPFSSRLIICEDSVTFSYVAPLMVTEPSFSSLMEMPLSLFLPRGFFTSSAYYFREDL